jgi:hypothetical protein
MAERAKPLSREYWGRADSGFTPQFAGDARQDKFYSETHDPLKEVWKLLAATGYAESCPYLPGLKPGGLAVSLAFVLFQAVAFRPQVQSLERLRRASRSLE